MTAQTRQLAIKRENIEAIFPLLPTQEAFLWAESQGDLVGQLLLAAELVGSLDRSAFQQAWDRVIRRHPVMRSSIHTNKSGKPMLFVWREIETPVQFSDLSDLSGADQHTQLVNRAELARKETLSLDKAPVSRIELVSLSSSEHRLFWKLHHAQLDGWSTSQVLADVLEAYSDPADSTSPRPSSTDTYARYLNWQKQQEEQEGARLFWQQQMAGFEGLSRRWPANNANTDQTNRELAVVSRVVERDTVKRLNAFCQSHQLTTAAMAAGTWSLTLSNHYGQSDVAFGVVVSGRHAPVEGIHSLVGLLANVIPLRIMVRDELPLVEWLQEVRKLQFGIQPYEGTLLTDIAGWCRLPPRRALIDSLLVIENYPSPPSKGSLQLKRFESGVATRFPITICFVPGDIWTIRCIHDINMVEGGEAASLVERMVDLLCRLEADHRKPVVTLLESRSPKEYGSTDGNGSTATHSSLEKYTDTEVQLAALWEQVLGTHSISTRDDFFDLGGNSLSAVRLMSRVEGELGQRLPPSTLVENPTIAQFASIIDDGQPASPTMIRFNRRKDGAPIVCVQAGPEYAIYYRFLASRLATHPVVGLHSRGLAGHRPETTFADIARVYLHELQREFSGGRIHLVGYCMGAAVALEMARQYEQQGGAVASLHVIDSGVQLPSRRSFTGYVAKRGWFWGPIRYSASELRHGLRHIQWRIENAQLLRRGDTESRQEVNRRRVEYATTKAFFANRPRGCAAPIQLVRSSHYASFPDKDFHLEWEHLTTGPFTVEFVDGIHEELLLEPTVSKVAAAIEEKIRHSAE